MPKFLSRDEYHLHMGKRIYGKDDCPFCDEKQVEDYIIWKGTHWYLVHNKSPYSGNHLHIMAVPYEHINFYLELSDEAILELREVHIKVKEFFGEENYFSFTRETMANRSVEHLHMHFLAWKLQWKYLRKMLEKQGFPITQILE